MASAFPFRGRACAPPRSRPVAVDVPGATPPSSRPSRSGPATRPSIRHRPERAAGRLRDARKETIGRVRRRRCRCMARRLVAHLPDALDEEHRSDGEHAERAPCDESLAARAVGLRANELRFTLERAGCRGRRNRRAWRRCGARVRPPGVVRRRGCAQRRRRSARRPEVLPEAHRRRWRHRAGVVAMRPANRLSGHAAAGATSVAGGEIGAAGPACVATPGAYAAHPDLRQGLTPCVTPEPIHRHSRPRRGTASNFRTAAAATASPASPERPRSPCADGSERGGRRGGSTPSRE